VPRGTIARSVSQPNKCPIDVHMMTCMPNDAIRNCQCRHSGQAELLIDGCHLIKGCFAFSVLFGAVREHVGKVHAPVSADTARRDGGVFDQAICEGCCENIFE
jgi:hypothetical protein